MKRLLLTCTDLMAIQFLVPHVKYLSEHGFYVELACSEVGGRLQELRTVLSGIAPVHTVRLVRNPFSLRNRKGLSDLKKIINGRSWDVIWTNEPVMGVMTRVAAKTVRKKGTKVVYMVHGFHFYKGAPLTNWLLYYPVEKYCSRLCDMIITINEEDYQRAKGFHAKRTEKIDGIGLDTVKFATCSVDRAEKRRELGVPKDAFFVVSVGELKKHKNHEIMIRALAKTANPHIFYGICGKGELLNRLIRLSNDLDVSKQICFLGYRNDIPEILNTADLFAFPSMRDGLGLAALEAMACGLPLLTSNIRGVSDYVVDGVTGFSCATNDVSGFAERMDQYAADDALCRKIGANNMKAVLKYDISIITETVCRLLNFDD